MPKLTQERIRELFYYMDGELIRRVKVGCKKAGSVGGYLDQNGYWRIYIDGRRYYTHVVVFLLFNGYFPEGDVDHINRNKTHNKIENLRHVSRQCNTRNSGLKIGNKSGVRGVYYSKDLNKWVAQIKLSGVAKNLGSSSCLTEAVSLRLCAEQCVRWNACDDMSSSYKYMKKYLSGKQKINTTQCQ